MPNTIAAMLEIKPDLAAAQRRWQHFWAGEVDTRPPVIAHAAKPGRQMTWVGDRYATAVTGDWDAQMARIDAWLESTDFLAESIPFYAPDFGPDQFAAFFGGELKFSEGSPGTNWVDPIIDDWQVALPLTFDPSNTNWQRITEYSRRLHAHSRGRYFVGVCDLHSNADTLSALASPQRLCMDFYDEPELIEEAMRNVRAAYQPIYDGLYTAGGMQPDTGSIGWIPTWSEGKFATIQCDFICMVSPEIGRKYIIPALAEEAAYLDHCVYHYDGPGALPHLQDILAIKEIDCIQWVSGDGQPAMHTWTELLHTIRNAGKSLYIYGVGAEEVKALHREFGPQGMAYDLNRGSREEVLALLEWLEAHS